jgi:hypothetical protein
VAWAARLEAVVLDAAPFVLAARWAPEVDRRMTALQVGGALTTLDALVRQPGNSPCLYASLF